MSDRLTELLLKAVRRLDQQEQDEVLQALLADRVTLPDPAAESDRSRAGRPGRAGPGVGLLRQLSMLERRMWGWPTLGEMTDLASDVDTQLKVLPVRLPVVDYDRLRTFSRAHGFSMAVITRTLVERFLDERAPRPQTAPVDPAPPA
jgi:hypothetical protein